MIKIFVNALSAEPLYRQIVKEIKRAVASGELKEGEKLPTVRELAISISVNPNTVARAYRELERGGIIKTFVGRGTFVAKNPLAENKIDLLIKELICEAKKRGISLEEIIRRIRERSDEK